MMLHLISGGAAHGLVHALAAGIRAATGLEIGGDFGAVGAMKEKLVAGAACDLVILTAEAIADLEARGLVVPGSSTEIGTVHTGIAVKAGDPLPDIADAAALRSALRAADAIHFPDPKLATAGIHFTKVIRQLGVEAELAASVRTAPNGAAAMAAMAASAGRPIGCTQVTEIVATPGVVLAGRLPHAFELATVYVAAVHARAARPEEAWRVAQLLSGPEAAEQRAAAGFST